MNALLRMRGEVAGARLRVAFAVGLLALLGAVLSLPVRDGLVWRTDRRRAADADVDRLIAAIMTVDIADARHLLGRRALDLNGVGEQGMTPLAHAIAVHDHPGGEPFATLLIEHGADVNQPDRYGHTPLMWCVSCGSAGLTERLLREGANVHACRPDGSTALHVAAQCEASAAVARMLLTAGADPTARDREGKLPADYAREVGLTELAQLLDAPEPTPLTAPAATLVIR